MNPIRKIYDTAAMIMFFFFSMLTVQTFSGENVDTDVTHSFSANSVKDILSDLKISGMNVTPEILQRMEIAEIQDGKNGDTYSVSRMLRMEVGRCIISKDCANPLGWEMIGISYWNGDDAQKALDALAIAIELSSKNPLVYEIVIRAIIKCDQGNNYDIEKYKLMGFNCAEQVYTKLELKEYKSRVLSILSKGK